MRGIALAVCRADCRREKSMRYQNDRGLLRCCSRRLRSVVLRNRPSPRSSIKLYLYMYGCMHVSIYVCVYMYVCVCACYVCVYIYIYVCMCVCIYVWLGGSFSRPRDTDTLRPVQWNTVQVHRWKSVARTRG